MSSDKTITLAEAVGHRFDSIFGEPNDTAIIVMPQPEDDPQQILDSPIIDLKSIVLSIEWEITEPLLTRFEQEVGNLEKVFSQKATLVRFLKILKSVGRYINKRKAEAHPDSIKLLSSAFSRFELVVVTENMTPAEQHELLKETVEDFNQLKKLISAQSKAETSATPSQLDEATTREAAISPSSELPESSAAEQWPAGTVTETMPEEHVPHVTPEEVTTDYSGLTPHEAFALAVEELKSLIKAEFSVLRAEIRMWREGQ